MCELMDCTPFIGEAHSGQPAARRWGWHGGGYRLGESYLQLAPITVNVILGTVRFVARMDDDAGYLPALKSGLADV